MPMFLTEADNPKGEKLSAWKTILAVGAVGLGLLFVGIVLRLRSKKSSGGRPKQFIAFSLSCII